MRKKEILLSFILGLPLLAVAIFGKTGNLANTAQAGYGGRVGYYTLVTPSSWDVLPGGQVSFTGLGFGADETVNITSGGNVGSVHTDGGGNFSTSSFDVGYVGGTKSYTFTGVDSGVSYTVQLPVRDQNPWIFLVPYYSAAGTTLTVQGHQFGLHEPVVVQFEGTTYATPTTSGSGEFETSFTIPSGSSGQKTVSATGQLTHESDTEQFSQAQ